MEDNELMSDGDRLITLLGLLAEAKLQAKEMLEYECKLLKMVVELLGGEDDETVH